MSLIQSQLIRIPPAINSFWDLPSMEEGKIKWGEVSCNGSQILTIIRRPDMCRPESILNPWLEVEERCVAIEGWGTIGPKSNGARQSKYLAYKKMRGMK